MKVPGARHRASQPKSPALPDQGTWTPAGVWIPAYSTRLWTPQGWLAAGTYTSAIEASPAGRAAHSNGSSTLLNWSVPSFISAFPLVVGGVFTVFETATTNQTAVGLGDGATASGGLYGGIGQMTVAATISAPLRMLNGGVVPEPSGPTAVAGRTYNVVRISRGVTDHVMYVNGIRYTSSTNTGGLNGSDTFGNFSISASQRLTTPLFFGKQQVALGFYGRVDPGDLWMREFSLRPWGTLFGGKRRKVWAIVDGAAGVTGTSATTNANDTSAASGTTTIVGSAAATNANDTSSAAGTTTIVGTAATTNTNDTSNASGTAGSGVSGSSATTNANDTSSTSGTTTVVGASGTTNANDISVASGWAGAVTGTSATTNANDLSAASGTAGGGYSPPSQRTAYGGGGGRELREIFDKPKKQEESTRPEGETTSELINDLVAKTLKDAEKPAPKLAPIPKAAPKIVAKAPEVKAEQKAVEPVVPALSAETLSALEALPGLVKSLQALLDELQANKADLAEQKAIELLLR